MKPPRLAIPALTFRTATGRLDEHTSAAYARRAVATWLSVFVLSGTTTEGDTFTSAERAAVLDIWRSLTHPERLLACCWEPDDITAALHRGIRPMAVMRKLSDRTQALRFFGGLPKGAYVYSHPIHTPTVLHPKLIDLAHGEGCLPAGAKISKVPPGTIPLLRSAAGHDFDLWDGSARRIAASLEHGASGVVATPLTVVPEPFPAANADLQAHVDRWQTRLDAITDPSQRARWLRTTAVAQFAP